MNIKKICCAVLGLAVAMNLFSFKVFAEIKPNTVVIGKKAYALDYANNPNSLAEISQAMIKMQSDGGKIYIKSITGIWLDNYGDVVTNTDVIPEVTYIYEDGSEVVYKEGDGDIAEQEDFYLVDIF